MMDRVILATKNRGKIKEVKEIFQDIAVKIISLNELSGSPDIVEDGDHF